MNPDAPPSAGDWPARLLAGLDLTRSSLHAADLDPRGWAALRMERRLSEPVPAEADSLGPLHTQVLLPRALQRLRELAPDYLQRLLAQVDGLALLPEPERKPNPRLAAAAPRRAGSRRSR
jgi:Protein of unknown function (DUF2894)